MPAALSPGSALSRRPTRALPACRLSASDAGVSGCWKDQSGLGARR
uniref:Htf9-c protein n=1 Tax=Mus musculus TaxID=10090 RepID=P70220_MOUSE|nr:Htf9-c [Mus musculus]